MEVPQAQLGVSVADEFHMWWWAERVCWKHSRGREEEKSQVEEGRLRLQRWVLPFASGRATGNRMLLGNPAREVAGKRPRAYAGTAACQQDSAEVRLPNGGQVSSV